MSDKHQTLSTTAYEGRLKAVADATAAVKNMAPGVRGIKQAFTGGKGADLGDVLDTADYLLTGERYFRGEDTK